MDKKFTTLEIIENLIGKIDPVGESNEDDIRFENLKEMCELADLLIVKIDNVAYRNKNRPESSIKRAAEYADDFLKNWIGIE